MLQGWIMLADRLYLIWNYGKTMFILGGIYNLACAAAVYSSFSLAVIVDAFIIKAVVAALIFYLISQFRKRDDIFFYINLGYSKRGLDITVLAIDFAFYIILMVCVSLIAPLIP